MPLFKIFNQKRHKDNRNVIGSIFHPYYIE